MTEQGHSATPGPEHRQADPIYHAIDRQRLDQSACFLCGVQLTTATRSDEHVIPSWVQDRFELWNRRMTLLNGTSIPYRQLMIPCCRTCNNEHLSRIERDVRDAVLSGYQATSALSETTLFLWLAKIFYGLLFKERFLLAERRSAGSASIVSTELLKQFSLHHTFLQAARVPIAFETGLPASVFVFPVQAPPDIRGQFDFRDSFEHLVISVRLGEVGILAALQDGRAQRDHWATELGRYADRPLHPLQFVELTAQFFYRATLLSRTPKFVIASANENTTVIQSPLGGFSLRPLFDDWDVRRYAQILAQFSGQPLDELFQAPDSIRTWLDDADGERAHFDFTDQPWPP